MLLALNEVGDLVTEKFDLESGCVCTYKDQDSARAYGEYE